MTLQYLTKKVLNTIVYEKFYDKQIYTKFLLVSLWTNTWETKMLFLGMTSPGHKERVRERKKLSVYVPNQEDALAATETMRELQNRVPALKQPSQSNLEGLTM